MWKDSRLPVRRGEVKRLMVDALCRAGISEKQAKKVAHDACASFLSSFFRLVVERKRVTLRSIAHGTGRSTKDGDFIHLEIVNNSVEGKEEISHGKAWEDFT